LLLLLLLLLLFLPGLLPLSVEGRHLSFEPTSGELVRVIAAKATTGAVVAIHVDSSCAR
jgi:hypothetical protein